MRILLQISAGENHKEDGLRPFLSQGSCQIGEGQAEMELNSLNFRVRWRKTFPGLP